MKIIMSNFYLPTRGRRLPGGAVRALIDRAERGLTGGAGRALGAGARSDRSMTGRARRTLRTGDGRALASGNSRNSWAIPLYHER